MFYLFLSYVGRTQYRVYPLSSNSPLGLAVGHSRVYPYGYPSQSLGWLRKERTPVRGYVPVDKTCGLVSASFLS